MSEFAIDYGLFLAKTLTLTGLLAGLILFLISGLGRGRLPLPRERLEVKRLNEKYDHLRRQLNSEMLPDKARKKYLKDERRQEKLAEKGERDRPRVFVLDFAGDIKASAVAQLREEITALLTVAGKDDQVFLRLGSAGGLVHAYGLAASQLARIREHEIPLTVSVDKVAASGGYMMACVASHILAAPFAILGSIGVVAQLPNFNRLLKKHDIDYEQFTAGQYKRTVTLFGENTDAGRDKFREEIETAHDLFKTFVRQNRPGLDMDKVSTGEHWYGTQALELGLVDELRTSDDWLYEMSTQADLYEIRCVLRRQLSKRIGEVVRETLHQIVPWGRN